MRNPFHKLPVLAGLILVWLTMQSAAQIISAPGITEPGVAGTMFFEKAAHASARK
jgi:hypothetical protein